MDKTKAAYIDAPAGGLRDALEKDYESLLEDLKIAEKELEKCNNMVNNMELIEKKIRNMRQAVIRLKHIDANSLNRHTIRSFVNRIIIHNSVDLCQYLGHKKLNFFSPRLINKEISFKLQEPRLQPAVVSCNQWHCDAFCDCKMTLYIQRVLFLPLQMYCR